MTSKVCTSCGIEKPITDYHFRKERGKHYAKCKVCWNEKHKRWITENPEKHKASYRKWADTNPELRKALHRQYAAKRRQDPKKRVALTISTRIATTLNGQRKHAPTFQILGYKREQLIEHLERQFTKGMRWDNYGKWHVDHIVPLSAFHFTSTRDPVLKDAWALSNLRPLWAAENMSKRDKREFLI